MKKGQLNVSILFGIIFLAAALVVGGVFLAFGADVTTEIQQDFLAAETVTATCNATSGITTGCGFAYNATTASLEGMLTVGEKQDTLGTIGVVTIILGLLIGVVGSVFAIKQYM